MLRVVVLDAEKGLSRLAGASLRRLGRAGTRQPVGGEGANGQPGRVLDTSAIISSFQGNRRINQLVSCADRGMMNLLLPTTAIAEAEAVAGVGENGWHAVFLSRGIRSMPLMEHCAIEIASWPGDLATRHAVHEAQSMRAALVTCDGKPYGGFDVDLHIV